MTEALIHVRAQLWRGDNQPNEACDVIIATSDRAAALARVEGHPLVIDPKFLTLLGAVNQTFPGARVAYLRKPAQTEEE